MPAPHSSRSRRREETHASVPRRPAPAAPAPAPKSVFTAGELALRWQVVPEHVSSLIDAGHLAALDLSAKKGGKRYWRIPASAVARFETVNSSLFDRKTGKLLPARKVEARR